MNKKIKNFLNITKNDDVYTVSPTTELQNDLGVAGYIKFENNKNVQDNDLVLTIEASKGILHIKTPLKGEILEINEEALQRPSLINSKDETKNWLFKLTNVNEKEFDDIEE